MITARKNGFSNKLLVFHAGFAWVQSLKVWGVRQTGRISPSDGDSGSHTTCLFFISFFLAELDAVLLKQFLVFVIVPMELTKSRSPKVPSLFRARLRARNCLCRSFALLVVAKRFPLFLACPHANPCCLCSWHCSHGTLQLHNHFEATLVRLHSLQQMLRTLVV